MSKREVIGAKYKTCQESEKELLADILDNFPQTFNSEKAKSFSGDFQFLIECDNQIEQFVIKVRNTQFDILPNSFSKNPYLNIECSFEMFTNITLNQFSPILDILSGKIKLDKGLFSLLRFAKFGALFSNRETDLHLPIELHHPAHWEKPQKILLVNGSPRKNASTKVMLDWFKEGLPVENTEVIDVSSLKMNKCLHCFRCWTDNPNDCVLDDDGTLFRDKITSADLIVFFVPLSWASMPSDMKKAMERLMPETTPYFYENKNWHGTAHPLHPYQKPQAFLQFLVWGFPERKHGKILEATFNEWATHSQKKNLGAIARPGVNTILSDPRLHKARKIIKEAIRQTAKSVYETGKIPKKQKKIIEKQYLDLNDWRFFATNYWVNKFKTDYWNRSTSVA
jgi:putative NADPH-quinone reductase